VTLAVGAVVALCAAGGGVAYAATQGSPADNYRTATASIGNVTETVSLSGTIASVNRRDAAFQASGTVGSINVTVGQKVAAGAPLASLDPASLTAALTDAQDTVTKATQTLTDDLASQTAAATTTTTTTKTTTTTAKVTTPAPSSTQSSASSAATSAIQTAAKAVTAAQQKLLAEYTVAANSLTATQALVTASDPTCQPFLTASLSSTSSSSGSTSTTTGSGSTSTPTPTPTPTPAPAPTPDPLTAAQKALADCQSAITGVLTSQQATSAAQQQVQTLATALNTAVAALTTALQSGTSGAPSGGASAPTQPSAPAPAAPAASAAPAAPASAPSGSGGGSGAGTTPATAETIVADEAAITAANAQLTIAQNDQSLGNLTSPIAGTVAAIAITPGSNVSAGSTTQVITVIGDGGYVVNSTATVTNVSKLKVQQPVTIAVVGSSKQLAGTVSSIGLMNVSTSTSPSYNVTVAVTDKTATLLNGTSAKLTVTASTATNVLSVPTSALHRSGTTYSVDVLKNDQSVPTTVKIGASGTQTTEITSGLSKGDVIILADLSSTVGISSTTTSTSTGLSGLGGSTTTTGRGGFGGGAGGAARPGGGAAGGATGGGAARTGG
jgi:multidrug efflux pump subunit AcrA (membrane-fusion protein)